VTICDSLDQLGADIVLEGLDLPPEAHEENARRNASGSMFGLF
jgi:hypothetical protein